MTRFFLRQLLTIAIYTLSHYSIFAQQAPPIHTDIHIKAQSIVFNKESYTPFSKGYTALSNQLTPTVEFHIDDTSLEIGYHFNQIAGKDGFFNTLPIIRLQQSLGKAYTITLGAIDGIGNRKMAWTLASPSYLLFAPYGYGLEVALDKEAIKSHLWLNWETFIQKEDPFQEAFTAGWNTAYDTRKDNHQLQIYLDVLFKHHGGQIDTSPLPATTKMNGGLEIQYSHYINDSKIGLGINSYVHNAMSYPATGTHSVPYKSGFALNPTVNASYKIHSIDIGYLYLNKYINELADHDLTVVSDYSDFSTPTRKLIHCNYRIDKTWNSGLQLGFNYRGFYDLDTSLLVSNYMLTLGINIQRKLLTF